MKTIFTAFLLFVSLLIQAQTTYYIDPAGNNVNSGSIGSPWRTLTYACAQVKTSGSIIHVNAGTYTETSQSTLAVGVSIAGDEAASSILHSHYSGGALIEMYSNPNAGVNGNQSISYLQIEGGSSTTDLIGHSAIKVTARNNVDIHHCTIRNFSTRGVIFWGGGDPPSLYPTGDQFHDNILTNCSKMTPGNGNSGEGALCIGGTQGMLVYNNTITNNLRAKYSNGFGIKYYGNKGLNKGLKIYHNTITQSTSIDAQSGFNFAMELWYSAGGLEIYDNVIHGTIDVPNCKKDWSSLGVLYPEGGYDFGTKIYDNFIGWDTPQSLGDDYINDDGEFGIRVEMATNYIYIYNNHIKNTGVGITLNSYPQTSSTIISQDHVYIYYNLFENIGPSEAVNSKGWGIQLADDIYNKYEYWYISNNVFTAKTSGGTTMYAIGIPGGYANDVVSNIFIRNNIIQNFSYAAIKSNSSTANTVSIENNILYKNGNSNAVRGSTTAWSQYTYQNNKPAVNPLFFSSGDFHLQAGSPAINAGLNVGLTTDYAGNAIVGLPDIGAYEFISGDNHSPSIQDQGFQLNENSPGGTAVGTVVASDPDAGQTLIYSIVSGNTNGAFAIDALTGVLSVANGAALNVDFALVIKVHDNGVGELSSQATIAINIVFTGIEFTGNNRAINVYPNPVSDELVIEYKENNDKLNFNIMNSIGQIVFEGNLSEKTVVQTTTFSPGVYIIKIGDIRSFEFKKIIKV